MTDINQNNLNVKNIPKEITNVVVHEIDDMIREIFKSKNYKDGRERHLAVTPLVDLIMILHQPRGPKRTMTTRSMRRQQRRRKRSPRGRRSGYRTFDGETK